MSEKQIYKVIFSSQGKTYEIFARQVSQGSLFGFIEVEELLFGERSQLVVDPSEDSLRKEFEEVRRTFIPMHAVLRIDEVPKRGTARIHTSDEDGNVRSFPMPIYGPDPTKPKT